MVAAGCYAPQVGRKACRTVIWPPGTKANWQCWFATRRRCSANRPLNWVSCWWYGLIPTVPVSNFRRSRAGWRSPWESSRHPRHIDLASLRRAAPNVLLGQWMPRATACQATDGADLVVCEPEAELLSQAHQLLPARTVLAWRPATSLQSVGEARDACELLQRRPGSTF